MNRWIFHSRLFSVVWRLPRAGVQCIKPESILNTDTLMIVVGGYSDTFYTQLLEYFLKFCVKYFLKVSMKYFFRNISSADCCLPCDGEARPGSLSPASPLPSNPCDVLLWEIPDVALQWSLTVSNQVYWRGRNRDKHQIKTICCCIYTNKTLL